MDLHTRLDDGMRPGFTAYASEWTRTRLTAIAPLDPRFDAVARTIGATCNVSGGVQLAQFVIHPDPELADYFAHNRIEADFFRYFFGHPDVGKVFWGLPVPQADLLGFCRKSGSEITEALERAILNGGAYRGFKGNAADARKLVANFTSALGDRLAASGGWLSEEPWSPWFQDVAWDRSFFWFDRGTVIATALLTTDTD